LESRTSFDPVRQKTEFGRTIGWLHLQTDLDLRVGLSFDKIINQVVLKLDQVHLEDNYKVDHLRDLLGDTKLLFVSGDQKSSSLSPSLIRIASDGNFRRIFFLRTQKLNEIFSKSVQPQNYEI
jgi:hypothetical protein